jgi:hypothetical protein
MPIEPMEVGVWADVVRIVDIDSAITFRDTLQHLIKDQVDVGWTATGGVATDYPLPDGEGKLIFIAEGFIRYELPPIPKTVTKLRFKQCHPKLVRVN